MRLLDIKKSYKGVILLAIAKYRFYVFLAVLLDIFIKKTNLMHSL